MSRTGEEDSPPAGGWPRSWSQSTAVAAARRSPIARPPQSEAASQIEPPAKSGAGRALGCRTWPQVVWTPAAGRHVVGLGLGRGLGGASRQKRRQSLVQGSHIHLTHSRNSALTSGWMNRRPAPMRGSFSHAPEITLPLSDATLLQWARHSATPSPRLKAGRIIPASPSNSPPAPSAA
uniref:Uncharacterized protein n=1 Tax=Coccidioides posadasii RMSCC 3488 TaxID=454284 RepID=A0A0J6F819_COCPO|nr:hypothetical protein CPAG_01435 [Coccidioides posadasii RMSCC 3488]